MKTDAKKWLLTFLSAVLVFVILLSAIVYWFDPFFQFRVRDHSYMLNSRYAGCGLIKNHDYDTLILGSSMTQNFDMQLFRDQLGENPLHVGLSGMRPEEELDLLELAYATGKANKYYICAELYMFTNEYQENRVPQYLINEDLLSRLRYFFSYEAWFSYMPVSVGFMLMDALGIEQSEKYEYERSIDRLGDWSLNSSFGEDVVLENYLSGAYAVTHLEADGLYEKMTAKIDAYFARLQTDKGDHVFFFPPYSMLYWADLSDEVFTILLQGKQYFIDKAQELGVTVYDFQTASFTSDLSIYKDTTHYAPEINDWMTQMFLGQEWLVTAQNRAATEQALMRMRSDFKQAYAALFAAA